MSAPITFGDTFTLPATGADEWQIRDVRPTSYRPVEDLIYTRHTLVAQAICSRHEPGIGPRGYVYAQYDAETGWVIYDGTIDPAFKDAVLADLNALDVHMTHRTDDEWRAIHFDSLRQELEQALGTTMLGGPNRAVVPHPLVADEETIAFAVATVAEIASQRPGAALFDPIYWATIERLRA